jgi:hypothetical protein
MNDERLGALYRNALASKIPHDRAGCPSPEDVAALADASLPEARRLALVDHVGACAECSRDLALLRSVAAARQPARTRQIALAAAAVVALAVGVPLAWRAVSPPTEGDVLRGSGHHVALVAPAGVVDEEAGRVLVWRRAEGAVEYLVELSRAGAVEFAASTRDTTLALPDSVRLVPGSDYEWSVETRVAGERLSAVERFRPR